MPLKWISGQTFRFSVPITLDGAAVDISADTVTVVLKARTEPDADAPVLASADVTTRGADGIALFDLSDEDMNIPAGVYRMEIRWARANGETYYPVRDQLALEPRVFD